MDAYKRLYTICIRHDYSGNPAFRAVQCVVSRSGAALFKRRDLLFMQTHANVWEILYNSESGGIDVNSDMLELELVMTDNHFPLYTGWDKFDPNAQYGLDLPDRTEVLEAAQVIEQIAQCRKMNSGFCQIRLLLTEDLFRKAVEGDPAVCTLQFHAPERYWEYVFCLSNNDARISGEYLIEEQRGQVRFPPCEIRVEYNRPTLYTLSKNSVLVQENYNFKLSLVHKDTDSGRKRTLLKSLPHPKTDVSLADKPDRIRVVTFL